MTTKEMRELDAFIAEYVMGWSWGHFAFVKYGMPDNPTEPIYLLPPERFGENQKCGNANKFPKDKVASWKCFRSKSLIPCYTTDPSAAMEVMKKCCQEVGSCDQIPIRWDDGHWVVGQDPATVGYIDESVICGETLELAICLFAKKLFS